MKKILITLTLLSNLFLYGHAANATPKPLDKMVAIVNDDLITRSELDHELTSAKMIMAQQAGAPAISDVVLEKQVLNQLINKKLQLQLAEQAGIKITPQEVDQAIKSIAAKNNVTVDELMMHVKSGGMTPETYRTDIHDQIAMQRLQQHEVAGKVSVTPEEINNYLKSAPTTHETGDAEYRLQDILIPTSDAPTPEELTTAKAKATAIMQQLLSGTPFSKISLNEEKAGLKLESHDLGFLKAAELPSAFADQVASMKKNSLAGPIQTGNGLHILHMTDLRKPNAANAAPDRKMVEAMLLQQKFEVAIQTWVAKLRSSAFITTAVA